MAVNPNLPENSSPKEPTTRQERIAREQVHGREIADRAEIYWGWGTPAGKRRLKRRARYLIDRSGLRPGHLCLEVGCGKGLYTRALLESGATVIPFDISWDLLSAARKQEPVAAYHVADAHRLPFRDDTFDSVVGVSVLHHLEVIPVLSESIRVLKRGGRFVFSEPNMLNPQIALQKNVPFLKRLLGDSPDETAFLKSRIRNLLVGVGLEVVTIIPFDFLHPWVPRPLIGPVEQAGLLLERLPLIREIAGSLLIVAVKP